MTKEQLIEKMMTSLMERAKEFPNILKLLSWSEHKDEFIVLIKILLDEAKKIRDESLEVK